jgi:predicted DCC family thiol-disulfide oxidoreductase YuxK
VDATPDRILVYDGDCTLCRRFARVAGWRWLVGEARALPHDAFEGEEAARLEAAGIRNELAVLERPSGEIHSGYDGILRLLCGGRVPWLAALLSFAPVRWLLRHDYRLVAYNRRILAPPRRGAACACDPDLHRGYRWAFIVAALLWTALFAALGGYAFLTERSFLGDLPTRSGGARGTPWTGPLALAGYLALAPLAWRLPAPRGLDFLGHLAWTFAAMLLPTIAAVFLALVGLLLAMGGVLPEGWALASGVPATVGAVAWGLALPIAVASCMWRLPRVGFSGTFSALVGSAAWGVPTALGALLLRVPFLAA